MTGPREDWEALVRAARPQDWAGPITFGVAPVEAAKRSGGRLVYVSTPLVLEGWQVSETVMIDAARAAAELARFRVAAVSPVVLGAAYLDVDMHLTIREPKSWARWVAPIRNAAGAIWVPASRGWSRCPQVWADVQWAASHGVPVMVEAQEMRHGG
ncbi:DUF1937 family protein [Thioclava sp. GXIMD4215]|uniref:DUF1937 family protein n=1 Tax=Thioclava sp. GXIMD4215 TaxID=3131928 RepID=UPI00324F90F8